MPSSGVRENVYLTITPTFDGVCGMLFLIILVGIFAKCWHVCHILCIFFDFFANFFGCWMWQMLSLLVWNQWIFLADVVCHIIMSWLMFVAIVADVNANLFVCGRWKAHWMMFVLIVADVIATIWIGWCYCHSGGWNYHIWMGWCFYPMQQMEQPHMWQLISLFIVANGMATLWLADVIAIVADGMATGWNVFKAYVITLLADVKTMGHYFNFSSVLLTSTSSHMWGRWYLPMFLFRDGLLTLIDIDSLISLERFSSSLPTILKFHIHHQKWVLW